MIKIALLIILITTCSTFYYKHKFDSLKFEVDNAEQKREMRNKELERLSEKVETDTAEEIKQIREKVKIVYRDIEKKVQVYSEREPTNCIVPLDWVRLHNAALPGTTQATSTTNRIISTRKFQDDLTHAIDVITHNYKVCETILNNNKQLQKFYKDWSKHSGQPVK